VTAAAVTLAVVAAVLEVVGIALTIRNIRSARDQLATFLSRPNTVYASAGLAAVSALAADVTSQNQTLEQRIDALEAWRRGLPDQLAWREQELSDTLRNDFRGALKASESTVGDQFMGLRDYVVGTGQTSWIKAYRGPFVQHRLCCLRRQNAAKHAGDRQADALIHTLQATLDEQRRARAEGAASAGVRRVPDGCARSGDRPRKRGAEQGPAKGPHAGDRRGAPHVTMAALAYSQRLRDWHRREADADALAETHFVYVEAVRTALGIRTSSDPAPPDPAQRPGMNSPTRRLPGAASHRYFGALQMLVEPTGRRMAGKWVGFGKEFDGNTGP